MTLDPSRALTAGVSRTALCDAVEVKAAFDLITRFADTVGARPEAEHGLTREDVLAGGKRFYDEGYV